MQIQVLNATHLYRRLALDSAMNAKTIDMTMEVAWEVIIVIAFLRLWCDIMGKLIFMPGAYFHFLPRLGCTL